MFSLRSTVYWSVVLAGFSLRLSLMVCASVVLLCLSVCCVLDMNLIRLFAIWRRKANSIQLSNVGI
jgi:hypothetical protein